METAIAISGWVGTFLVVLAYLLLSVKKLGATSLYYQGMNFVGAAALGVHVFHQQAWAAVTLQVIWGLIALFALFNMRKKKSRKAH